MCPVLFVTPQLKQEETDSLSSFGSSGVMDGKSPEGRPIGIPLLSTYRYPGALRRIQYEGYWLIIKNVTQKVAEEDTYEGGLSWENRDMRPCSLHASQQSTLCGSSVT
jgi:hypothetical protein